MSMVLLHLLVELRQLQMSGRSALRVYLADPWNLLTVVTMASISSTILAHWKRQAGVACFNHQCFVARLRSVSVTVDLMGPCTDWWRAGPAILRQHCRSQHRSHLPAHLLLLARLGERCCTGADTHPGTAQCPQLCGSSVAADHRHQHCVLCPLHVKSGATPGSISHFSLTAHRPPTTSRHS